MTMRRVVVTGMGVISPIGIGVQDFLLNLRKGKSGIRKITRFPVHEYPCRIAAEVDFEPTEYLDRREARKMDRFSQFAVVAARMAIEDAGLQGAIPESSGVVMGTGIGGMETFEREPGSSERSGRVSPFFIPMMIANMAAGQVSIDLGRRAHQHRGDGVRWAPTPSERRSGLKKAEPTSWSPAVLSPITPTSLAGFAPLRPCPREMTVWKGEQSV